MKTVQSRDSRGAMSAETAEELSAGSGLNQRQCLLQAVVSFSIAGPALRRWRAAAECAGEVAVVTSGSGHGGVANHQIAFDNDQFRAHGFIVRSRFVFRRIIDRNEFTAGFEPLIE